MSESGGTEGEKKRIYLDHAATGWPKPPGVYEAMDRFAREVGASSGRGGYRSAATSDETVAACRRRLARLIHAADASRIAFFSNGTAALNAALLGVIRPGDHVVTTSIEHNSVARPLEHLRVACGVDVDVVRCDSRGSVAADQLLAKVRAETRLVAISHASNVCGTVQPVEAIGRALADTSTVLLCDAAQTLGYLPVNVADSGIDLLAAPGHKGACGPLGTGMLYVSEKAAPLLRPSVFGGTGSQSQSLEMPAGLPAKLEPGNLNVPAIAGWRAGLEKLLEEPEGERAERMRTLAGELRRRLEPLSGVRLFCGQSLPIASLTFDSAEVSLVAALLDSEYGIEVRSGLHCAAMVHDDLGTTPEGTLRISGGHTTNAEEIASAASALGEILAELGVS